MRSTSTARLRMCAGLPSREVDLVQKIAALRQSTAGLNKTLQRNASVHGSPRSDSQAEILAELKAMRGLLARQLLAQECIAGEPGWTIRVGGLSPEPVPAGASSAPVAPPPVGPAAL